jgi:hypothetical protein
MPDEFEFLIDTLEGETLLVTLSDVGAAYPSDDVIYFFKLPCWMSSARAVENQTSKEKQP